MRYSEFLARVGAKRAGSGGWQAKCPAHFDKIPSLSISEGRDEKILLKCFAGCSYEAILAALNLRKSDMNGVIKRGGQLSRSIEAAYDYHDADGKLLYQVVRFTNPKDFRQRRPVGIDFEWNMRGVTKVPFRLPSLIEANMVLIAEGEKDVLTLEKAAAQFPAETGEFRFAATCNVGGAGKWKDEYSTYLKDKFAFVFQDNDDAGRAHAQQVCASVAKHARKVCLIELQGLPEKGDVSDWLQTRSSDDLLDVLIAAPTWGGVEVPVQPTMAPDALIQLTGELLDVCVAWILNYVVVSQEQAVLLATWVLHTYVFSAAETTPYIHITAPEKECGKSRLMDVLATLAFTPVRSGSMTVAALVRTIEAKRGTIFLDEMDAQLGGNREVAETIRGILNEGFRKGGVCFKCVGTDHNIKSFNVYCPKCFAGIGVLPATVASRSIPIVMRRKLTTETVASYREKAVKEAAGPIKSRLVTWASQGLVGLLQALEVVPSEELGDRQRDMEEPLLSIALLAGGHWPDKVRAALHKVLSAPGAEDPSMGVLLLTDIREIFDQRPRLDRAFSRGVVEELCKMDGRPWAEVSRGKEMTLHYLAAQLKGFGIRPQSIRIGETTGKGYFRAEFEEAWKRYCPTAAEQDVTPSEAASSLADSVCYDRNSTSSVTVVENASYPHEQSSVTDVTATTGLSGIDPPAGVSTKARAGMTSLEAAEVAPGRRYVYRKSSPAELSRRMEERIRQTGD